MELTKVFLLFSVVIITAASALSNGPSTKNFLIRELRKISLSEALDNSDSNIRIKRSRVKNAHHRIVAILDSTSASSSSEEQIVKVNPHHRATEKRIKGKGRSVSAGFAAPKDYDEDDQDSDEEFTLDWENCRLKCCNPDCLRYVPQCAGKKSICAKVPFMKG